MTAAPSSLARKRLSVWGAAARIADPATRPAAVLGIAWVVLASALAPSAAAFPAQMLPAHSAGQTWVVCQGYNNGRVSHSGTAQFGLDVTADLDGVGSIGCKPAGANVTANRQVVAPGDGTIAWNDGNGFCVNFDAADSMMVYHVTGPSSGARVARGQVVGNVYPSGQGENGDYAHTHIAAYAGTGCAPANRTPFAGAARLGCGAPEMPSSGAFNQWAGTQLTSCTAPSKPVCESESETARQDTPKPISLRCSGEGVTYSAPSAPAHGTVSGFDSGTGALTYTPASGYTGPDSFTFTASNGGGESDRSTVSITVLPPKPSCTPVTATVTAATQTVITLTCAGTAMTYAASAPEHGTTTGLDPAAGTLTYTPAAGYTGPDSFSFGASNPGGDSDRTTASITVVPLKPSCVAVAAVVATGAPSAMSLSCTGQALTYAASAPAHGTISGFDAVAGTLTYTPVQGYRGPDSFSFGASNPGGDSDRVIANITISTPPAITNFRARSSCVTSVRMRSKPVRGKGGLAFSYTLNQRAEVLYVLYRRDSSPQRRTCPKTVSGHTQDTFTQVGTLAGSGDRGSNGVVIASSRSARATAPRQISLRRTLRAGRHRVTLAAITRDRVLAPGTYVVLATATNSLGQRSTPKHTKFFALASTPTRRSAAR